MRTKLNNFAESQTDNPVWYDKGTESMTSMISGQIGRHEVLLPINHKNYNFRKKKSQMQVTKEIAVIVPGI